jgi:hypothetical protein
LGSVSLSSSARLFAHALSIMLIIRSNLALAMGIVALQIKQTGHE